MLFERWFGRKAPPPPVVVEAPPPEPTLEIHHSPAIEAILAEAHRRRRALSVLDLGPARPSTFAFVADFARRVRVVDLEHGPVPTSDRELAAALGDGTSRFDLVFGWDLLDRLDRATSTRLAKHLDPLLAKGCLVHLLASRTKEIATTAPRLEIHEGHSVSVQHHDHQRRPGPGWSQREIELWLPGCATDTASLHQTGFFEVLLRRTGP